MHQPNRKLLITGDIITMDPIKPRVSAIGVVDGRVVASGDEGSVKVVLGSGVDRLAMPGTVVPGMIDSHVHMLWGGRDLTQVDVSPARSVVEVLALVRAHADANPQLQWISGSAGIDTEEITEARFPTAAELHEAAGGRPVFLSRRAHDALVSTEALRLAGIDATTPDPPGGVIERDEDGAATGFLVERPAAGLVERVMPSPALEDRLAWLDAIQREFLSVGITSVVDPALEPAEMLAYAAAAQADRLIIRTMGMPLGDGEVAPDQRARSFAAAGVDLGDRAGARWRIGPWKLFLDGGGSLGTALLYDPWPGTDGYHGNQTTSTTGLNAYGRWAARTGVGLGVHAVGSAAIDLVLDAFTEAAGVRPLQGLGFTLIHAYLWPSAEQMRRCRDLGVLVATQSPLQYAFAPGLIRRFGEESVGRAHPMRSWIESGAIVGGGSDGPGGPPVDPLWSFWQMRTRAVAGREDPIGVDETVTAAQALMLYTTGAAAVMQAPELGRLAPGSVADLVALGVDPLSASPEACRDGRVLATVVDGEIVYEAE
jgi:predicted amidohydrolase YtcJ